MDLHDTSISNRNHLKRYLILTYEKAMQIVICEGKNSL